MGHDPGFWKNFQEGLLSRQIRPFGFGEDSQGLPASGGPALDAGVENLHYGLRSGPLDRRPNSLPRAQANRLDTIRRAVP